MATSLSRLAVHDGALGSTPRRREARTDVVRIVEYTRFPRAGEDVAPRLAFTRDLSPSGMCIGTDEPERAGTLLRVVLRLPARSAFRRCRGLLRCDRFRRIVREGLAEGRRRQPEAEAER